MTTETLNFFVETGYRLYSGDDSEILDTGQQGTPATPLIDILPSHSYLLVASATEWGEISLTYRITDHEPALETGGWDEVHDVSLLLQPAPDPEDAPFTGLAIEGTSSGDDVEIIPLTVSDKPSWWRVRLQVARNQEQERHLLTFWPAPQAEPTVHQAP
ncbi:hypothetical protein [Streptomyces sp. NPDC090053]|uniref:hypothetical protein n=1 Tax=Streptomyces sp. NPDC090053 TaxID=3365932 RepID=UPI00382FED26